MQREIKVSRNPRIQAWHPGRESGSGKIVHLSVVFGLSLGVPESRTWFMGSLKSKQPLLRRRSTSRDRLPTCARPTTNLGSLSSGAHNERFISSDGRFKQSGAATPHGMRARWRRELLAED